jgi:hypothetical protein
MRRRPGTSTSIISPTTYQYYHIIRAYCNRLPNGVVASFGDVRSNANSVSRISWVICSMREFYHSAKPHAIVASPTVDSPSDFLVFRNPFPGL